MSKQTISLFNQMTSGAGTVQSTTALIAKAKALSSAEQENLADQLEQRFLVDLIAIYGTEGDYIEDTKAEADEELLADITEAYQASTLLAQFILETKADATVPEIKNLLQKIADLDDAQKTSFEGLAGTFVSIARKGDKMGAEAAKATTKPRSKPQW